MNDKEQYWYFTFGYGHENAGYCVKIKGSYGEARQKMFDRFGDQWCFQYSEEEWKKYEKKKAAGTLGYPLERLLDVIE